MDQLRAYVNNVMELSVTYDEGIYFSNPSTHLPYMWKKVVPMKFWHLRSKLHGVTYQLTINSEWLLDS